MEKTKSVAIVMGYGIPPDIRKDANYRTYLSAVAQEVKRRGIEDIIFCGGSTNIYYPKMTEAGEMYELFADIRDQIGTFAVRVCLVEHTITSWENLEAASRVVRQMNVEKAVVFCEKMRRAKVWFMAWGSLPCLVETIGVDFDAGRNLFKDVKQFAATFWAAAEYLFPPLRKLSRRRQLRHIARVSRK